MTINQIQAELSQAKPGISFAQLRRYMRKLEIGYRGNFRESPAQYAHDAAEKIKTHLGLSQVNGNGRHDDGKVVGLKKLRNIRSGKKRGVKC